MRYLMNFSYDGSSFNGYQKQVNKNTVQDNIEDVLKERFGHEVSIYASGRTDAGVHAINQYAHFDLDEEVDLDKLVIYLNDKTRDDIYIKSVTKVNDEFNARFSALSKTYKYVIRTKDYNLFYRNYELYYGKEIDINRLEDLSNVFIGEHDFENFTTIQDKKETYVRFIESIRFDKSDDYVVIYITGHGFLRFMVRNIIGCFLDYNDGKLSKEDVINMLDKKTDMKPVKVKACGLYLCDVEY